MATQQGDKKPANYYGGYSLYRGGSGGGAAPLGNPAAAVPPMGMQQAHRKMAAAFNADWFAPGMMPMMFPMFAGGVVPTPQQPLAPQQHLAVDKSVAPVAPPPTAIARATPIPFLGNLFPAPQNAYRGAPVRAAAVQPHQHVPHHHRTPVAPVQHAALSAKRTAPVPHYSDTWNAFDGVVTAPTQRHAAQHLDPIGTPAPRSVWAGTPAGDVMAASQRAAGSSSLAVPTPAVKPFSVWTSTPATNAVTSRSGASTPEESREAERMPEQQGRADTFAAVDVNSDDEDWIEHLKTTLHVVLGDDAQTQSAQQQPRSKHHQKKQHVEMEWAGMKLQGA